MYQGLAYDIEAVMPAAIDTGLFVSLVTIQQPDGVLTDSGAPSENWLNVSGLVNIPAMDAPEAEARIRAKQEKTIEMVEGFQFRHVLLSGYYPTIAENANYRAIVDGVAWDLIGVESDSQNTQTRLLLQLASI